MEKEKNRPGFIVGIFIGAFLFGMFAFFVANAFNGPTQSPGNGSGAIGVGSGTNDISIGTSSPSATVTTLIVGSTTDSTAYALQVLEANGTPILYVRNDGGVSIGTTTVAAGTLTLQGSLALTGNGAMTSLTVSGLGSSGSPCLSVGATGAVATTTCGGGGGGLSGGTNNWIPLWTSGTTLGTSTLQQNGTTTYTVNGFAIGTSTVQSAGNLFITGNYLGGTLSASLVSSNAFASGNFAFPSNLNIGTSSTAGASALSVYGSELVTGATTLQSNTTLLGVTEASGTQYYSAYYANVTSTGSATINWNNGNEQSLALGANTALTFTNSQPGGRYILMLVQDSTGSRTVTWPSGVQWPSGTAPTLTTTAKKMDIITFVCATVSSTDCYGGANLNYSP